jgi:hypothetical protein
MTSHVGRLYALTFALVVFFLGWAAIAARPWARTADPRLQALAVREAQLRREAALVKQLVAQRHAIAQAQLQAQQAGIATGKSAAAASTSASSAPASPSLPVKVVNLPPLTVTRTS